MLVFDELGFVPFDREGGELLFNLLSARHGCSSTVITSNLDFSGWPHFFSGDEQLTAAVLDRLSENGVVLTTKCQSRRQDVWESMTTPNRGRLLRALVDHVVVDEPAARVDIHLVDFAADPDAAPAAPTAPPTAPEAAA